MASYSWQPFSYFFGVRQTALHRRLPPWELMKIIYEPSEDSASNTSSSYDSIDSDLPFKPKRRSYRLLLREIRRLRAENDGLHQMVDTIKQDLRFERESRQISERCHQKYYNESCDRQEELEDHVLDKEKEIEDLKQRLECLEASPAPANTKNASVSRWGCFDFDDDDELYCQPVMGESASPDPLSTPRSDYCMSSTDDDDDDDDDDDQSDDEKFEQLATTYLKQAILSKLTSARANLELDDLMLKYDPSPAVVLRTLASSFVIWVDSVVTCDSANVVNQLTINVTDGFLSFWKAILEKYVHDDADQCQFLNEAERHLERCSLIVENYHRLLFMLYKYDILDGDAISHWWHESTEEKEVGNRLRRVTQSFAQWLDQDDDDELSEDLDDDEDDDDDDDDEHEHESSSDSDTVIDQNDALGHLLEEDRQHCACQFEHDTKNNHTTAHIQPEQSESCKCDTTYNTPPHTAEKKPKKTVRILL